MHRTATERIREGLDRSAARIQPVAAVVVARATGDLHRGVAAGKASIRRLVGTWARTESGRRRLMGAFSGRRARVLIVLNLILAVLVGSLLPPALALANALRDYQELRALGTSAVQHLLAAKDDFEHIAGPSASLLQAHLAAPPAPPTGPYTLLVQRQAGTFYPFDASIHPSPQLAKAGFAATTTSAVIGAATALPLQRPGPHAPTPTPPSPSPSASDGSPDARSLFDLTAFTAAQAELKAAQADFQQLHARLDNPDWVLAAAGAVPQADKQLAAARTLTAIGSDLTGLALELCSAAQPLLARVHGGSLLGGQALLTQADLDHLQRAIALTVQGLASIQSRVRSLDVSQLPIPASQKATFVQLNGQLAHLRDLGQQIGPWISAAGWLLGVGQPRHFLVQTLDRAELRPSGGFTGDYGVLSIQDGALAPFALNNVNDIDYGYKTNGWIEGQRPPAPYSWWPFGNWGLRDSNLSADFPTTARINMQVFKNEGGGDVDGVIQFTPVAIEHALQVTGPIDVPDYQDTITAQNLEDRLHYYQLDPAGIAKQQQVNPGDTTHSLRKRFTQLLAQLLQDKVRHLPASQLVQVARLLFADLRAGDVQIYVADPPTEALLAKLHASGAVDTTPGLDGYMLVQANTSAAKSTPYVRITQHDDITLDDRGGATHQLVIQLDNHNLGVNVYGFQAYRDYVRIYAPPGARLTASSGFDTGQPLCWAPLQWQPRPKPARFAAVPDCPANPYPAGEMICTPGYYGPGPQAPSGVLGTDGKTPWVLDRLGPPTASASDVPGRAMWGAFVNISPGCVATLRLSWYVSGVVHAA